MMDFEEVLEEFKLRRQENSRNGSTATADRYARHVRKWQRWLEQNREKSLWDAEYVDLRVFIRERTREGLAPTTISQRVSAISKFYQDAAKMAERPEYRMPDVPENPYDGLDSEDKQMLRGDTKKSEGIAENTEGIYYLTPEEVESLSESVPAPKLRNELLVRLLFDTGLRREELAKAKLEHLDRDDKSLFIPARKSENPRVVTYTESYVGFHLSRWLDHGGREAMTYAAESDYLSPTNDSEHINPDHLNQIVKDAAEEAGLQETVNEYADGRQIHKVTAHTLRHSYAVQAVKSGIDIRALQQLLGHEDIDTTMVYLKLADEDVKAASRQFNPTPHAE